MDAQEFRKDFLENVKAEAAATGEGSCAAFVDSMAQHLIEAEVLPLFLYQYDIHKKDFSCRRVCFR